MRRPELEVLASVTAAIRKGYRAHLRSDRAGEEYGWLLLGRRYGDCVVVTHAIGAGGAYQATDRMLDFDREYLLDKTIPLISADLSLQVVGTAHSHVSDIPHPSSGDITSDRRWGQTMPGPVVAGIVTGERGNMRIDWFTLPRGARQYRAHRAGVPV